MSLLSTSPCKALEEQLIQVVSINDTVVVQSTEVCTSDAVDLETSQSGSYSNISLPYVVESVTYTVSSVCVIKSSCTVKNDVVNITSQVLSLVLCQSLEIRDFSSTVSDSDVTSLVTNYSNLLNLSRNLVPHVLSSILILYISIINSKTVVSIISCTL